MKYKAVCKTNLTLALLGTSPSVLYQWGFSMGPVDWIHMGLMWPASTQYHGLGSRWLVVHIHSHITAIDHLHI